MKEKLKIEPLVNEVVRKYVQQSKQVLVEALEERNPGISVEKIWHHHPNLAKTRKYRKHHRELDGVRIPYKELFKASNGMQCLWPHHPSLPPGETFNCHCDHSIVI